MDSLVLIAVLAVVFVGFFLKWRKGRLAKSQSLGRGDVSEVSPSNGVPKDRDQVFRPRLIVDVDTSPLTNAKAVYGASPYYLVLDTETYEAIPDEVGDTISEEIREATSKQAVLDTPLSLTPVAISWQILDADGRCIREQSHIICSSRHTAPISTEATAIHGITTEMLSSGSSPKDVYASLEQDLEDVQMLVAHNAQFHLGVLLTDAESEGVETLATKLNSLPRLCTMELGRQLGFKARGDGQRLYPRLDEFFGYLYFARLHLQLSYESKTLRDVRLVASCLRLLLSKRLLG